MLLVKYANDAIIPNNNVSKYFSIFTVWVHRFFDVTYTYEYEYS